MVGGTREKVSEQLLYSIPYTVLCDCGRPIRKCQEEPCFFVKILYPFIEMRMDEITLTKKAPLIGFTEAEKEELRKSS